MSSLIEKKVINGIAADWLELKNILIKKLPKGYTFNSSVSLDGSSITELPEEMVVKGNLYIGNASLTKLPKGLIVGGYLDLRGSIVEELGENTVASHILFGTNKPTNMRRVYYSNKKDLSAMTSSTFVVTDNKLVIPYGNFKRLPFHKYGPEDGRSDLYCIYYQGLDTKNNAISYSEKGKRIIAHCSDLHNGVQIIERWRLANRDTSKWDSWNVNDLHTVEEIRECYIAITDACIPGIQTFIDKEVPDPAAMYPVSWLLEHTKDYKGAEFNYLFEEYWKNKEIK
jgi:hypothetical protein